MNYNEEFFSKWHEWFYDVVKQCNPDMPVYSKMMAQMTSNSSAVMERGVDYTLFADWADVMCFDGGAYIYDDAKRIEHLLVQDMMNSVTDKPLYNSENHLIPDGDNTYDERHARHIYNQLWQGAIHGLNASTIWVWARNEQEGNALYGSILNRPDCLEAAAFAGMDLNRNMDVVTAFQNKQNDVGIFYSEASNLYDTEYKQNMVKAYETLLYNGLRCGFVSEEKMELLSEYDTLVIPHAAYAEDSSVEAINEFVKNGGRLIYIGDECLSYDEFTILRNEKPTAEVVENTQLAAALSNKIKYQPIDAESNQTAEKISAECVTIGDDTYINVCNYNSVETQSIYLQSENKIFFYENLTEESDNNGLITLEPLESVLLKVKGSYNISENKLTVKLFDLYDKEAWAYLAVYKPSGRLARVEKKSIDKNTSLVTDFFKGEQARMFVWNENMKPLEKAVVYQ